MSCFMKHKRLKCINKKGIDLPFTIKDVTDLNRVLWHCRKYERDCVNWIFASLNCTRGASWEGRQLISAFDFGSYQIFLKITLPKLIFPSSLKIRFCLDPAEWSSGLKSSS